MNRLARLVDPAALAVLGLLAVATLGDTYSGWQYLAVAAAGLVLGMLVAEAARVARLPAVVVPVPLVVTYLLLGGALVLRNSPDGSWVPAPATWRELVRLVVEGWTQLLTTLPPVDSDGPLLALPLVVGLAWGGAGLTVAGRVAAAGAPLLVTAPGLLGVILLGTGDPGSVRWVGVATAVVSIAWLSVRSRRRLVQTRTGATGRLLTAAVVLGTATAAVLVAAPVLPGTGTGDRTVLRAKIVPPLDLSAFPSPLVGFRKYRPVTERLADRTLFTVRGLPTGTRVRIATLDDYDGRVWTVRNAPSAPAVGDALDTFQRIGSRVQSVAAGRRVAGRVTIAPAYATEPDTNGWLPDAGGLTGLRFGGADADRYALSVRYNLATGTGVVPRRLRPGTSYRFTAVVPRGSGLPRSASAAGTPSLEASQFGVVQRALTAWTADTGGSDWQQVLTVADHLRDKGAYSDGGGREAQFLPGHGAGRIAAFLAAPQLVGDDEQYAATFALMANAIGVPARVVVGAATPAGGVVRGRDVHAWVELRLAGRGWVTVPTARFTPPTDRHPNIRRTEIVQNSDAAVVPPPNAVRPPSSLDRLAQSGANSSRRGPDDARSGSGWQLPGFVRFALRWVAPPLGVLIALALAVLGLKAVRRRRRRLGGTEPARIAAGWREVLDQARDLGVRVGPGLTRREQAAAIGERDLTRVADLADRSLFGGVRPGPAESVDFWVEVGHVRREMLLGVGPWRRWRARLSPTSLRGTGRAGSALSPPPSTA